MGELILNVLFALLALWILGGVVAITHSADNADKVMLPLLWIAFALCLIGMKL